MTTQRPARMREDLTTLEAVHLYERPGGLQRGEFARVGPTLYHRCMGDGDLFEVEVTPL